MIVEHSDLATVMQHFNPWWEGNRIPDLPQWHRPVLDEIVSFLLKPPVHRTLLLGGGRQIGKTTLMLQAINRLLESGVPPRNILYVTFDNALIKQLGLDGALKLWRELVPAQAGIEYLFIDET